MPRIKLSLLGVGLLVILIGCERRTKIEGPTVNKFSGKLVADGKPVTFAEGDKVFLKLMHTTAQSFSILIAPDGTFNIGEMPIGKYTAQLSIEHGASDSKKGKRGNTLMNLPEGFEIKEGQTDYTVELGKKYKPQ